MNRSVRLFCAFLLSLSSAALAQNPGTGLYAFGSFDSRGFDTINLGNLNTHFGIPIVNKQGRGLPFTYTLAYDGLIWSSTSSTGTGTWQPASGWGFNGVLLGGGYTGYMTSTIQTIQCPTGPVPPGGDVPVIVSGTLTAYVYTDPYGRQHAFNYSIQNCDSGIQTFGDGTTSDGSGYFYGANDGLVHTSSGQTINAPFVGSGSALGSITDANGNTVQNNGNGTFTDTLGVTALTIGGSGTAASPLTLTYPVALQADGATSATVTVSYKTYTVQTNFQCSGIVEYGANSVDLIDHITLPDASASTYTFTYEATPGVPGAVTGRLASVKLPTQRSISYSYTQGGCNGSSGINPDGTPGSMTRVTDDGTRTYTRSFVNANATNTTVTDEKGNQFVYQFTIANSMFFETERSIYQGAAGGTALLDRITCYNGAVSPCNGSLISLPISETITLASNNGGSQFETDNFYDASGGLTSSTLARGSAPISQTTTNGYNSLEELVGTMTTDGFGNVVSSASYGYDETAPTATSGLPQHSGVSGARRNQTSVKVSTGSGTLTTTTAYYDTGVPVSTTTPNGTTGYGYDSTQTFVTQTTLPTPSSGVALATSASYEQQSGALLSATGMNAGQTAQVTQYDRLLRPVIATLPNGSRINYSYPNANETMVTQSMGNGSNVQTITFLDGYGRTIRNALNNGQSNNSWYIVDSCYDATGSLSFQSTKYQGNALTASLQCSGSGTSYTYDALGRVTGSTNADGPTTNQYNGRAVLTTDVNGVRKIVSHDLLGRVSDICEVSSNTLQGESPQSCPGDLGGYTGFVTHYAYDLANHKTTITQGAQTRVFQTDAAGRTIYTSEPERGVTNYSYTYGSSSPCTGVGLCVTRTRPRANQTNPAVTTSTTTQYDSVGRPVSITYNDGTPTKTFTYDVSANWTNFNQTNLVGLLSTSSVATRTNWVGTTFSYDAMGNVIGLAECLPSQCGTAGDDKHLVYQYDLAGNMTSSSDGAGVTTSYTYSPAGEVQSITSSLNDATHPGTLISSVQNGPSGPLGYSLGNGLTNVSTRDALGRLNGGYFCNGSSAVSCSGGTQVYGFTNSWQGVRSLGGCDTGYNQCLSYGYDEFNRLTSRSSTSGVTQFTYVYDRYGNRWQQNALQGGPAPQLSFNVATNQVSGYTYDAAGNVTSDGQNSYQYDAEGNLIQAVNSSTFQYTYNALNQQVRLDFSSPTFSTYIESIFNAQGKFSANWNNGNFIGAEAYWGSTPVESYFASPTVTAHFLLRDALGSMRFETNNTGAVTVNRYTLPFGDGTTAVSGSRNTNDGFAGLQDGPSGNHAQFRDYSNVSGRWLQPDPYDGSYDGNNPQSFNRYSYVLNNPLAFVDPQGRCTTTNVLDDQGNVLQTVTVGADCPVESDSGGGDSSSGDDGSGFFYYIPGLTGLGPSSGYVGGDTSSNNPSAPSNTAKRLACAAKYGQAHSIGALFGGGTIANFLGGNSVSGVVNLGLSLTGNQPLSGPPNLTGIGLGLPVNDVLRLTGGQTNPLYGSASGTIRSTAIQGIFNAATDSASISSIAAEGGAIGVQGGLTAGEFASGVGVAKLTLDAATFGYGLLVACR